MAKTVQDFCLWVGVAAMGLPGMFERQNHKVDSLIYLIKLLNYNKIKV